MGWVRVSDDFYDHPAWADLDATAVGVWIIGLAWANRNLTDGRIPAGAVKRMDPDGTASGALIAAGRWHRLEDGAVEIHDYLDYQRSAELIKETSAATAHRAALRNNKELVREIRARDGNRCRYCGRRVDWTDRKSTKGGTYDHLVPRGPNTADNVVVACRGCSSRKGARTPEAAGMPLLEPGTTPEELQISDGFPPDIKGIRTPTPTPTTSNDVGDPPARRGKTKIPSPFEVTPEMESWARERYPQLDWARETEKFVAWAKANDRRYADWLQAWRNWMHRATEGGWK